VLGRMVGQGPSSSKLILLAIWTISGIVRYAVIGTQHAIFVMSDGQIINLSLPLSHLELESVLVDSPDRW
jgi:hypothetical protein